MCQSYLHRNCQESIKKVVRIYDQRQALSLLTLDAQGGIESSEATGKRSQGFSTAAHHAIFSRRDDRTMKVILVHNYYQQPGGEDRVYAQERQLLESHGHEVVTYQRNNSELLGCTSFQRLSMAKNVVWAKDSAPGNSGAASQGEAPRSPRPQYLYSNLAFDFCRVPGGGCSSGPNPSQFPATVSRGNLLPEWQNLRGMPGIRSLAKHPARMLPELTWRHGHGCHDADGAQEGSNLG